VLYNYFKSLASLPVKVEQRIRFFLFTHKIQFSFVYAFLHNNNKSKVHKKESEETITKLTGESEASLFKS